MSLCPNTSAAVATRVAPAAPNASSPNDAASPAPRSTRTEKPAFTSRPATSGVKATRRSLAAVSFGTPMFMNPRDGVSKPISPSASFPAPALAPAAAQRSRAAPRARRPATRARACDLRGPTLEDRMLGLESQVGELAERLDFAERLLAQARERGSLPKG